MSRDADGQQRLWLSLGYGGKNADPMNWRYWKQPKGSRQWIISAPNGLAEFEQHDRTIFYRGKAIFTGDTQWSATWRTLAYFYEKVVPTLPEPAKSPKNAGQHFAQATLQRLRPRGATTATDSASRNKPSSDRSAQSLRVSKEADVTFPQKVWIGPAYSKLRILVLGESWYGDFPGKLVTDDGYIRAYLEGKVVDAMYSRIANACELERKEFWNGIMFTNFVQRVGATRDFRPTGDQYKVACERLAHVLAEHAPRGVWILGVGQGVHSAPVVHRAGIAYEVSAHPTSYGLKNATLGASWKALLAKSQ